MATEWERMGVRPPSAPEPPKEFVREAASEDPAVARKGRHRLARWLERYDVPEGAAEREAKRIAKQAARYGLRAGRAVGRRFLQRLEERWRENADREARRE